MTTAVQYDAFLTIAGNQTQATLAALMAAVPLDLTLPQLWGVIPTSDVTANLTATSTRRRIRLDYGLGTAAITANMFVGDNNGGSVASLTLGVEAGFFAAPPILVFSGGGTPVVPASAVPIMGVTQSVVARGGIGYTGAATAALVGGNLAPGGVPATLGAITLAGGHVVAVAIATAGSGYTTYPTIVVTDPAATQQAEVYGALQIVDLTLINAGTAYGSAPTITTTPVFPTNLAPGELDGACFSQWMDGVFKNQLRTPVSSQSQYV
jgi:hypothetical protein